MYFDYHVVKRVVLYGLTVCCDISGTSDGSPCCPAVSEHLGAIRNCSTFRKDIKCRPRDYIHFTWLQIGIVSANFPQYCSIDGATDFA